MHDQLPAYFDCELDETRVRTFEDHLAACPDGTRELAALRELRDALLDDSCCHRPSADLEGASVRYYDRLARIWDATTGKVVLGVPAEDRLVDEVAFSPDGRRVAGVCAEHVVKMWDAKTGAQVLKLAPARKVSGRPPWPRRSR